MREAQERQRRGEWWKDEAEQGVVEGKWVSGERQADEEKQDAAIIEWNTRVKLCSGEWLLVSRIIPFCDIQFPLICNGRWLSSCLFVFSLLFVVSLIASLNKLGGGKRWHTKGEKHHTETTERKRVTVVFKLNSYDKSTEVQLSRWLHHTHQHHTGEECVSVCVGTYSCVCVSACMFCLCVCVCVCVCVSIRKPVVPPTSLQTWGKPWDC